MHNTIEMAAEQINAAAFPQTKNRSQIAVLTKRVLRKKKRDNEHDGEHRHGRPPLKPFIQAYHFSMEERLYAFRSLAIAVTSD